MHTGSLINLVEGNSAQPEPEVGMGATVLGWTDRYAATVVEVPNARTVVVQLDHAKRTDDNGVSEAQSYEYSANPTGRQETYTKRKNGRWVRKGEPLKEGTRLALGFRNHYHDYTF